MDEKNLIIFTGPSGVGKSTVQKYFINDRELNLYFSVSATSRPIRKGEKNGVEYWFLTKTEFKQKIKNKEFFEREKYAGNYYGTLISEIEKPINQGKKVYLEIEAKGAKKVMKRYKGATTIFLVPPTFEDLKIRLLDRKSDTEKVIKKRIKIAKKELRARKYYKFVVTNDDPKRASDEIKKIIQKA